MRIALVVHGLPPYARNGVETHAAALAGALATSAHQVEVFAPRRMPGLALFAQRRETRHGWAVTWVNVPAPGDTLAGDAETCERDLAQAFGAFLDRERPEVVHFEHLAGVGLGAVEEAKRRGLPTVLVAHDYSMAAAAPWRLAPDLTDLPLEDREAEGRARIAQELLDGVEALGEHQGAALESQLEPQAWERLQGILHGPPAGVGGLAEASEAARQRAERRRAAFAAVDARFATSRSLAKKLSGTLGRAVDWRAAGVALAPFEEVAAPARHEPVRFGYLGGIDKHLGLHLLLDAFGALDEGQAALSVYGDSEDRAYLRAMRRRAEEVGATWGGPYRADDVAGLMGELDVVVLPSLWVENAPFVIREAFAARRAVIAPRTEAIEECVRDDVDGVLFDRGDGRSLTAAMLRFIEEDWLFDRLVMEIEAPKRIEAEAEEWLETYGGLVEEAAKRRSEPRLPAHLEPFAARYYQLEDLPTRALFAHVVGGLTALAKQMGLKSDVPELLTLAVGRGSRLRDGVVEDRRTIDWLERSVSIQEAARRELEERASWHEGQIDELKRKLGGYQEQLGSRKQELEQLTGEVAELRDAKAKGDEALQALEHERAALSESVQLREVAEAQLAEQLSAAEQAVASLEEERGWLKRNLEEGAAELAWLREHITGGAELEEGLSDREAIERHFSSLQEELAAIRRHQEWLHGEVASLVGRLGTEVAGAPAEGDGDATAEAIRQGVDALKRVVKELAWRREEMSEARRASQTLFARLAGGGLVGRVRAWAEGPPASVSGDGREADPRAAGESSGAPSDRSPDSDRAERAALAIDTPLDEPAAPLRKRGGDPPTDAKASAAAQDDAAEGGEEESR